MVQDVIPGSYLEWMWYGTVLATTLSVAFRYPIAFRHAAALTLGCWIALNAAPGTATVVATNTEEYRGRLEGTIIKVNSARTTVLVDGELDLQHVPASKCRVLVRIPTSLRDSIVCGQYVVASVSAHRPHLPLFNDDFSEASWAQSNGASFVSRAFRLSVVSEASTSTAAIASLASYGKDLLARYVDSSGANVMWALVLGDEQGITQQHRALYTVTGTAHVLAVSGAHVAILAAVLLAMFGGKPHHWWQVMVAAGILGLYVLVTGADTPAIRAYLAALIMFIGYVRQRSVDAINILGAVVLLQVLYEPMTLRNIGFVLSTIATLTLVTLTPRLYRAFVGCLIRRSVLTQRLSSVMALNISAASGVALPVALLLGQYPVWSPAANLFVVPLMSCALVAGLFILATGWWFPWVAIGAGWTAQTAIVVAESCLHVVMDVTPRFTTATAVGIATLCLVTTIWLTSATSLRQMMLRCSVGLLATVLLSQQPAPPPVGVFVAATTWGLHVRAIGKERTAECLLGSRHGIPFVRSLHEHHVGNH